MKLWQTLPVLQAPAVNECWASIYTGVANFVDCANVQPKALSGQELGAFAPAVPLKSDEEPRRYHILLLEGAETGSMTEARSSPAVHGRPVGQPHQRAG